jgi:hypothetical protein
MRQRHHAVLAASYPPKEFGRWEDCARGADVLLQAVLALAV